MRRRIEEKRCRIRQTAAVILCAFLVMGVCGGCTKVNTSKEEKQTIKIGVTIYRGDDAFISSLAGGLEEYARTKEEELNCKIMLNISDAKNSQSSQNDQVDEYINNGYDAICVNMVDRTVAAVIADKAKKAGIPLIFFNREPVEADMNIWEKTYYVGTDAREAGEMQGQMIVDMWKQNKDKIDRNRDGKLQYVLLEGEQVHQDALIRTEYSVKTMIDGGLSPERLAQGGGNWMRSPAYELTKGWIEKYGGEIEVVLSNNDEMALGAIEALEAAGMSGPDGPVIMGIDGSDAAREKIAKGEMAGSVVNDAPAQAEAIIDLCCMEKTEKKDQIKYKKGQYVRVPHYKLTKDEVQSEP